MFDGITYNKGAAVLLMTENYLGEETFRKGVHTYLQAHLYGNATAEDFWNTMQVVSGKPVDKVMQSLVVQPGEPLLTFGQSDGGRVRVVQKRFFLNPDAQESQQQSWVLPVCMKTSGNQPDCSILDHEQQDLPTPQTGLFYGNAGGKGYYRSRYDGTDYQQLIQKAENGLTPAERITFLGSQWALAHAGVASIADFLDLASAVRADSSPFVIETVTTAVGILDQKVISIPEEHDQFARWVSQTFAPVLASLGPPTASDTPRRKLLRANLFELVGDVGADPAILAQAKEIAESSLRDPNLVDATLAARALKIAAQNGDAAFFAQLQQISETSPDPQLKKNALLALARFRDPALATRALQYAVSSRVRNQDAMQLLQLEMGERRTRDLAWKYVQEHWPLVQAQITTSNGAALLTSMGNFCSAEHSSEVARFFAEHTVPASARALEQARDNITDCVNLRATQGPDLQRWLAAR